MEFFKYVSICNFVSLKLTFENFLYIANLNASERNINLFMLDNRIQPAPWKLQTRGNANTFVIWDRNCFPHWPFISDHHGYSGAYRHDQRCE